MGPSLAGPVVACWAFGLGLVIWLYNHETHGIGAAWLLPAAAVDAEEARCNPGEEDREGEEKERRLCR
jgi:hypothetical protein